MSPITRFSVFFIERWRFTILLLIGILALGFLSYTTFLKKEGFPSVQPPVAIVNVTYPIDNAEELRSEITTPIEVETGDLTEVKSLSSSTRKNTATLQYEFPQRLNAEEGLSQVKDAIGTNVSLPDKAEISYSTVNAAAINGDHEMLLTLSNDGKSLETIQKEASTLAEELRKIPEVSDAEAIKVLQERTNPRTGKTTTEQVRFTRTSIPEEGKLVFEEGVHVGLIRNTEFGTLAFSEAVRSAVSKAVKEETLPENYKVTYTYDPADQLNSQLSTLEENALTGLLTVAAIVLILISWRASLLVAIFLPTVMAGTFMGLFLLGYSLNTITLFGIILVLGLIADDAIIVIDAIDYYRKQGYRGTEAVKEAINSIGPADISGTLTTVLVFIPLLFVSGVLGEFIRLMPATIILSLLISVFVGLGIMPFLGNSLLPNHTSRSNTFSVFPQILDWITSLVHKFVSGYVSHPTLVALVFVIGVSIVSGVTWVYGTNLKLELFAPASDTNQLIVRGQYKQDTSLDEAQDIARTIETQLTESKYASEITKVNYITATESQVFLYINLTPMNTRNVTSTEIISELEPRFSNLSGIDISLGKGGAGPPVSQYQVTFNVFAEDTETLETVTSDLQSFLKDKIELENGQVTKTNIPALETIRSQNGERYASVQVGVSEPNNTALTTQIKNQVQETFNTEQYREDMNLDEDTIRTDLGQEGENLQSFRSALFAFGVAIIAMYMLLVLQFNSLLQPILILSAIPLALPGVAMGLFFTDNAISFFATVGVIGLTGIVVNNTILLIDTANQNRTDGKSLPDAISSAVKLRFRPLVTTSLTTLAGMLPLALSDPFWEGLAFALIFGLLSSTVFVILLFPSFYIIMEQIRRGLWYVAGRFFSDNNSSK